MKEFCLFLNDILIGKLLDLRSHLIDCRAKSPVFNLQKKTNKNDRQKINKKKYFFFRFGKVEILGNNNKSACAIGGIFLWERRGGGLKEEEGSENQIPELNETNSKIENNDYKGREGRKEKNKQAKDDIISTLFLLKNVVKEFIFSFVSN